MRVLFDCEHPNADNISKEILHITTPDSDKVFTIKIDQIECEVSFSSCFPHSCISGENHVSHAEMITTDSGTKIFVSFKNRTMDYLIVDVRKGWVTSISNDYYSLDMMIGISQENYIIYRLVDSYLVDVAIVPNVSDDRFKCIRSYVSEDCVICLIEEPNITFLPCGHKCCHERCGKTLQKCPMCKGNINSYTF